MDTPKSSISSKVIDKIYDDTLHSVANESGKFLERVPRLINAALAPLDQWILHKEYSVKKVKKILEENLKKANPDKIVSPEPYVAIPAIQAISYSMDSNELRNLYANLLTKAIYKDTKNYVHPSYVEIIKNLSPLDCKVFDFIMKTEYQTIGYYEIHIGSIDESSYSILLPYLTQITFDTVKNISISIDALIRNNLIRVSNSHYNDNYYEPIRQTPVYLGLKKEYSQNISNQKFNAYKMAILSTNLGKSFYNICSTPL